jgi:hypothetical protein
MVDERTKSTQYCANQLPGHCTNAPRKLLGSDRRLDFDRVRAAASCSRRARSLVVCLSLPRPRGDIPRPTR